MSALKPFLFIFFAICFWSCSKTELIRVNNKENELHVKAFDFLDKQDLDNAFRYFAKAKDVYRVQGNRLMVAKCLINMAIISTDKGDHYGGQETLIEAFSYLNKSDTAHAVYIASCLHTMGLTAIHLKNFDQATRYLEESITYAKNNSSIIVTKNSIANAYRDKKNYPKAITLYTELLQQKIGRVEYARILSNLSFVKWLQDPSYPANLLLKKALAIRIEENDSWGQNASYARLSDFYAQKHPDSAFLYAKQMYGFAKSLESPDDQLEALQKLIRLNPVGNSKIYFERYAVLMDSLQTVRNSSKNQFALIRYEMEKHKAENLELQQRNTKRKYQIISLIVGILTVLLVSIVWYKKRKQRLELASKNAIRENQLRTSKKVHDVVANGIYKVMVEIENNINLDRNQVLDKLEDMYEKSRDLSYEEINYNDQNFHEKIAELLKSFAAENRKVVFVGNTEELWKKVNAQIKYEIEHILQELMVNMKKHSRASSVAIRFEKKSDRVAIYYTDDGIGMLPEQQFKNGLTNTGNRIISINGEITFDTKVEKGLKIQISFPIS